MEKKPVHRRIQRYAEQCATKNSFDYQQFAELIIQHCASIPKDLARGQDNDEAAAALKAAHREILDEFGLD